MQNTLTEPRNAEPQKQSSSLENPATDSEPIKIEFRHGGFPFRDGAGYVLMAFVCCVFFCSGVSPFFNGPYPTEHLVMGGLIAFLCLVGLFKTFQHACKRYEVCQDKSPLITLTDHSLHDHRNGTQVNLNDVTAIQFNQKHIKGAEAQADLCLTLQDESVSVFNLKELDVPSEKIADAVKHLLSGSVGVKVKELPPTGDTAIMKVLAFVMVAAFILKVVLDIFQR